MKNGLVTIIAIGLAASTATTALASSSRSWAELMKRASASCAMASELKKTKTGTPVDFSDKVLVIVEGNWPQPHMKNAPARFACLYDKRTQKAEVAEFAR